MDYWKKLYYELSGEVENLEEEIHALDCAIYRAIANQGSLKSRGVFVEADEEGYDNKTVEEQIEISKKIYNEAQKEKLRLEKELERKKSKLILISRAIIEAMDNFLDENYKLFMKQNKTLSEKVNQRVLTAEEGF